jgi:hypothetical protein
MDSELAKQPPEVLRGITSFLTYYEVAQLARTNNHKIIALLTRLGGVRELHFNLRTHSSTNKSWPTFHQSITTLKSLTIESGLAPGDNTASVFGPQLIGIQSLPQSLTSLTLVFPMAEESLAGVSSSLDKYLPHLVYLDVGGTSFFSDASIRFLPSSLTWLQLRHNDTLTDGCGPNLPTSLVHLALPRNIRVTPNAVKTLTSLQVLKLKGSVSRQNVSFLPSTLEELEIIHNDTLEGDCLKLLPASLTKLNMRMNKKIKGNQLINLPANLLSLTISTLIVDTDLALLGRNMTHLSISSCKELTDEAVNLLPRTLTAFDAWDFTKLTDSGVALLPRGLRLLWLSCPNVTDYCAQHLPPTLTNLRIQLAPLSDGFLVHLIAPHLVHLELNSADISNEAIGRIPRTVKFLHLASSSRLTGDCVLDLPPGIRVCSFWAAKGFAQIKELLPPTVTLFLAADFSLTPLSVIPVKKEEAEPEKNE